MSITVRDLTTGEIAGSGLFDELMRTTKAHIETEHTAGRITDASYAQVYLGALQSNLQTAIQFTLQYQLNNQQILVLQEQVKQAQKQNELLELQKAQLQIANDTAQYTLDNMLPAQYANLLEQNKTAIQTTLNSITQGELLAKQVLQAQAQIDLSAKQEDMVDQQIHTEKANTVNPTGGLTLAQFNKLQKELDILTAKEKTEVAQTTGTKDTVGGLLKYEMELKENQSGAFLRDAEQKAAKFYADMLSIVYSADPTADDSELLPWRLGPGQSQLVMEKLLTGINIDITEK